MKFEELFLGSNKLLLRIAIELNFIFLLKAWKIMSDKNELDPEFYFDYVYNKTTLLCSKLTHFKCHKTGTLRYNDNINIFKELIC